MDWRIRQAQSSDVTAMHRVRLSVAENRLISVALSERDYVVAIEETGRGWVGELAGEIVAFSVGNSANGSVWACLSIPAMKEKVMAVSCTTSWWLGFGSGGTSGYGSPPSRVLALSASIKKRVGSALERLQAAKFGSSSRGPTTRYRRRARRPRASVDVRPTTNRRHSSPEEHGDDHF